MTEMVQCDKCLQYFHRMYSEDITRIEITRPGYGYVEKHYCPKCVGIVASILGVKFEKEELETVSKCR